MRTICGGSPGAWETSHDDTSPEMTESFEATKQEEHDALLRRGRKDVNSKQVRRRAQLGIYFMGSPSREEKTVRLLLVRVHLSRALCPAAARKWSA